MNLVTRTRHSNEFIPPATRFVRLAEPFPMKRGGSLRGARIAYETWGRLSAARDNAVLLLTGLSPNAHAASHEDDATPGWWEDMLGPGKPIDTDRWFVVCVNALGSCKGSTGPASLDPATGLPYRLTFPELSIEDIADAAAAVVEALGIERLACVIGASMGGMSALALMSRHPGIARSHVNVSGAPHSTPFAVAIRSLQRQAIRRDPCWKDGFYDDLTYPESGMTAARILGFISYRSASEWDARFGRARIAPDRRSGDDPFGPEFQIEAYLHEHARRFVRSYDPNCYLYLSRAIDWYDLAEAGGGSLETALASLELEKALVLGVSTDILFPLEQQRQIADGLRRGGVDTRFVPLDCVQGHDAFLLDIESFGPPIADHLAAL